MEAGGYGPGNLDRGLLTHFDLDHAGGITGLKTEAPIHASEPDASFADGSAKPAAHEPQGLFQRLTGLLYIAREAPIERVADGHAVGAFTARHTPGRTPGHATYLHADPLVALLGDLVRETDGRLETPPCSSTTTPRRTSPATVR